MEEIYQITRGCENDARIVQWRVKKKKKRKGKKLVPKASHLRVHIIYFIYFH